jgi:hypothetical protein
MKTTSRITAAIALALMSAAAHSAQRLHTSLAAIADDDNGRGADFDVSFAPNPFWTLDAGFGSTSQTRSDVGEIEGTSLRTGIGVRSERFGLRGYYRHYSDSTNFETDTIGARASMRADRVTLTLIAEERGFDVEYAVGAGTNAGRNTAGLDANGYGAGVSYVASGWAAYAEAVFYDFGSQLDDFEQIAEAPTFLGIPLAQQFTGSVVTFKHGVLDHQITAGVERGFQRSSFRLDWTGVKDAINGAKSSSFSGGYQYSFSERTNVGLTLGVTDSDFGSTNFAGASLGVSF